MQNNFSHVINPKLGSCLVGYWSVAIGQVRSLENKM